MTTHTPTPWEYKKLVGDVGKLIRPHSEQEYLSIAPAIDAAHIVACVNAHDELVAALREIISQIDQGGSGGKVFARDACITGARALLAKVTP